MSDIQSDRAKKDDWIKVTYEGNEHEGWLPQGMLGRSFRVQKADTTHGVHVDFDGQQVGVFHGWYKIEGDVI